MTIITVQKCDLHKIFTYKIPVHVNESDTC